VLEFIEEAYIVRENANVVLTRNGRIKRVGRLASLESTRVEEGDQVIAVVPGSTLDTVAFFADDGTAYTMRINEVPATSGYGEPVSKFFKFGDGVKVIAAVSGDPRFTPADQDAKGDVPGGPYLLVATSGGNVLQSPFAAYRPESTKAGRRYVKLDNGDKVVMAKLVADEPGVMLASRGGHLIHFPLEQVNILAGVGKGVMGIKLDDDECIGGALVNESRRYETNRIVVETETGKEQEFGPLAIKSQNRGGKGERPGTRTKFSRVVPPPIELVNWDEVEGKAGKKEPEKGGNASLFE
jgi:DNA gyrase subunit A